MTAKPSLFTRVISSSCLVMALAAYGQAQGADSCSAAQPLAGLGTFPFDNTAATPDGPADCNGLMTRKDVWWSWTAPATGGFRVSTCGGTSLPTRIVVYDGTNCGALNPIDCNTGSCINQGYTLFPAVGGQNYLIRIGSKQIGVGGSGTFTIADDPCPTMGDDTLEENDTCSTGVQLTDGTYNSLIVHKSDDDWYIFEVPDGATLQIDVLFTHSTGDIDVFLYDSCGGTQVAASTSASDNEQIIYDNTTGCRIFYKFRVEHWAPDAIAECNTYSMIIAGTGTSGTTCGIGTNYCTSNPNSTGAPALISATGSESIASNNLVLVSAPVPNQPGIFFYANNQLQVPFGNGFLCAAGTISRLPVVVGSSNVASFAVDYATVPATGPIIVGANWNFQFWYRDPSAGGAFFNTSDGLNIIFIP